MTLCTTIKKLSIMRRTMTLFLLMFAVSIAVSAYDIAVENEDGVTIFYNKINDSKLEVTGLDSWVNNHYHYFGKISIPSQVTYSGNIYNVTSIGSSAFRDCPALTSILIPNGVTSIGFLAFDGCTGLGSIEIPSSVTSIGGHAFRNTGWFSQLPNGVVYINRICYSYKGTMPSNTNVKLLDSTIAISECAFSGCTNLISIEIPSNVISIGNRAFEDCVGLTSINIPSSVTSIGYSAFSGCTNLTSINIPSGVTSIGNSAFSGCKGLTSINIPSDVTSIGNSAFSGCTGLASIEIPSGVTSIGSFTFSGCTGLTSVEIPCSVTSIGINAFEDCTCLTSVIIEDGETTLNFSSDFSTKNGVFYNCTALQTLYLGRNISYYSSHSPFKGSSIKELTIGDKVTSIGDYAFSGCSRLTSVEIPSSVKSIGYNAFYGCSKSLRLYLPDNITNIGTDAFNCKLYSKRGTKTLLTLWKWNRYKNSIYDKTTGEEILPPTMSASDITQTTAKVLLNGCKLDDGYTYSLNEEVLSDTIVTYQVLKPATPQYLTLTVKKDDITYTVNDNYTTKGLQPRIENYEVTASSISATGAYTEEDAKVVGHRIKINGYYFNNEKYDAVEGNEIFLSGLNPGRGYNVEYTIEVDYGGEETATYIGNQWIYTDPMKFQTAQAKVVSVGNVIVSTTVNLDENEENVGFEWRCTDWTDEFPSNTGTAYLYDGIIEGYIRNLNTDKLWKFRPYYLSNSGIYHYGDWMGVDPTNTSYFEPTVRTYAKINIEGNTALVKGYVLGGTDDVVVKGFKYWRTRTRTAIETRAASIPSDAITVEATGQQTMSANLTGLDYNSTYHYIAFATTSAGDTYYGEEQMFTTPLATSKYSTFYDSETAYILPSGLTASVVTGVKDGKLVYKVIAEGGKSNNILPKGVAVMLTSAKGQPSSYTLTPTESTTSYNGENLLKGSDKDTKTFADGGNYWLYKLSYGASGSDYRDVFGWYWGAANGGAFQIEGHKAWLAIPKSTKMETRGFSVDGDATDIYSIDNEQLINDNSAIYNLQGHKVDMPQSGGIYIVNGKKVFIK